MKEILATKLESKHRQRMSRRQRNLGREKSRERTGNHRKSLSSNTIERDVNVAESFYRQCGGNRSQASDVNEDLSLRGSKYNRDSFPDSFSAH